MSAKSVGLVGLGVMGRALSRNLANHAFPVVNFSISAEERAGLLRVSPEAVVVDSLAGMVAKLAQPRVIILMVTAGQAVDDVIAGLLPLLERGDVIIDGGNSFYKDTLRRQSATGELGVTLLGVGISGGEEGALTGASIMAGGARSAYLQVAPMLEALACDVNGEPCAAHVGSAAAGHFVKMVHNGIEYGMMQLIAECADLLQRACGYQPDEVQQTFAGWRQGPLASFLIDITADVLARKDDAGDGYLVASILDVAGQKGTGRWTSETAIELGHPVPTIIAAVTERQLSAMKAIRVEGARKLGGNDRAADPDRLALDLEQALYGSFLATFAQGLSLINAAGAEYGWDVDLEKVLKVWRGGCIIRSSILDDLLEAHRESSVNMLFSEVIKDRVTRLAPAWRRAVSDAVLTGVPVPALSVSLAYYDSLRSGVLPTNLIQAQRDYFGAHTYERIDRPGTFHTEWQEDLP